MRIKRLKLVRVLCLIVAVFVFSCNSEITDFFESIKDYGYRSSQPLGPEKVKVNDKYLGGYVYKGLPLIISKKSDVLYEINFLTTSLYKEDRIVEAHATKLGGFTFMNLKMGDYFCFLKFNILFEEELEVELVRNSLKKYIEETKLKSWLKKNADKGIYKYVQDGESKELDAYYSFSFSKITIQRAYQIQEEELYAAKQYLFSSCSSYSEYERLVEKYPEQEFRILGERNLFESCKSIDDYNTFLAHFPDSKFRDKAEMMIAHIREEQEREELIMKDKLNYELALKENTIEGFENYMVQRYTDRYVDSVLYQIGVLARDITKEEIEWKWTGGEPERAMQYIFYKIDYVDKLFDASWTIEHLSYYAIKYDSSEWKEKTVIYMDKLIEKDLSSDDMLNLFMEKGFLLWSMGKGDLAVSVFGSKITSKYESDGVGFKDKLKSRFKYYKSQEVVFRDQKAIWKRIKKLK